MPAVDVEAVGKEELLKLLRRTAKEHGLHYVPVDHEGLRAELEVTHARWFFGGRTATYCMECRLDEACRTVRIREVMRERSWGIPAPFIIAEKAPPTGRRVSGTRLVHDAATGPLELFQLLEAVERVVRGAGWKYCLAAGKP